MERLTLQPRPHWQAKVEEVGLSFHTPNGVPYWDESACYRFTAAEIDTLEAAANELHQLCIEAAGHVIETNRFAELGIPKAAIPLIKNSWERDDFSLYGRFDFAYDGQSPPKLLEYNADTPTSLVEAAVAQWYWLEETRPQADQFNSLHERLIAAWRRYATTTGARRVHLGGERGHLEDEQTVLYIQDTCHQAGLQHRRLAIQDVGLDDRGWRFVGLAGEPLEHYFKLYPWEWIWHYGDQTRGLLEERTQFLEPMWKMLLSNKALLPILWELFPGHPNLLPCYTDYNRFKPHEAPLGVVEKPKLSREGANVKIINRQGVAAEWTPGEYGHEGFIYQALAPLGDFQGNHPVLGVWIVDHECAGMGIREDKGLITGNLSRFVPHYF